jgi:hypothetical protein
MLEHQKAQDEIKR